ncbi:MAG TPA: MFS transporter [Allosphingosinicella sp.]|nr:MFS transporter [Allosphingosinicella sp.]
MTSLAPSRPRGLWYHGWNIVVLVVLSQIAANGLALNSMSLFLQDWSRDLHAPISALLLATLPFAIVISLSSPFIGMFADKYPARLLIASGLIGIVIFCLLMSVANATWQIWVLYGSFFPISLGLCGLATVNAVVSRWFIRRIGLALGITALGSALGGVILPPIIAEIMPAIGWRSVWRGAALVTAVVILPLVLWIVRDRPAERDGLHYLGGATHAHGAQSAEDLRSTDILKRRNFWLLVVCYTPVLGLNGAVQQNIAPIAASHGFDQSTAGMLLAVFSVSQMFAILLLGLASDRFGNRLPLASLSVAVTAGAIFLTFGDSLPPLVAGSVLIGFAGGIWTLMPAAVAAEFGASGVGRAFGMLMFFLPISALASSLMAKIQESTGSYAPALMGVSALCLAGGAAILFMRERRGGHLTPAEEEAAREETLIPFG